MYAVREGWTGKRNRGERERDRTKERLAKPVSTYNTRSHNYLNDVLCGKRFCSFVFVFFYFIFLYHKVWYYIRAYIIPHSICKLRCCQKLKAKNPAHRPTSPPPLKTEREMGRGGGVTWKLYSCAIFDYCLFAIYHLARMFAAHPSVHCQPPASPAPVRLQLPRKVLVPLLCPTLNNSTHTHLCKLKVSLKYINTHVCVCVCVYI